jgi:predicted DNA-binding protein (UPF0251 family)
VPRPRKHRRLKHAHQPAVYKPVGVPLGVLDRTILLDEELEALRLADLEQRYQEDAAEQMAVSRSTFQRIVTEARRKVAFALVHGTALQIESSTIQIIRPRWHCNGCGHNWQVKHGSGEGKPSSCPVCSSRAIRERGGGSRRKK